MVKYSSLMTDSPDKQQIMGSASYCVLSFALFPYVMSLFGLGFSMSVTMLTWAAFAYHAINFVVAVVIFREHLQYSWMNVSLNPRGVLGKSLVGTLLMVVWGVSGSAVAMILGNDVAAECTLPVTEMTMFVTASWLVTELPVVGGICCVLLTPFTISLLYYATVFAPICSTRPKLAYLVTALIMAVPHAINAVTFWDPTEEILIYLIQLPVHLIACRLYQKTDTVWAPIFSLAAANLVACVLWTLIFVA